MKWYIAVGASFVVASVYLNNPVLAETKPKQGCAELLRNQCQTCHYLPRVCSQVGEKSKQLWKSTMKRMVDHGAELNKDEQQFLVNCLQTPAPDIKKECGK